MSDREAMKLALKALDTLVSPVGSIYAQARKALRTALAAPCLEVTVDPRLTPDEAAAISSALAAPEPEPVAYFDLQKQVFYWAKPTMIDVPMTVALKPLPLYAAPPALAATKQEPVALAHCPYTPPPSAHFGYVLGDHWLETAYSRVLDGEAEAEVLKDCGWERVTDAEALRRDAESWRKSKEKYTAWQKGTDLLETIHLQHAENERLKAENERLREALRGIAKIDFRNVDSIWARLLLREVVDKTKDALRREDV